MQREWPPDFFPHIEEPQKTSCNQIMDAICSRPNGKLAFCNLRWDSFTLATFSENPEVNDIRVRYNEAKAVIAEIVGEESLAILLRAFADDVDH